MMCSAGSPLARAASTYSRLRIESVCARSTRAPHDHPVTVNTITIVNGPLYTAKAASRIARGSVGNTSRGERMYYHRWLQLSRTNPVMNQQNFQRLWLATDHCIQFGLVVGECKTVRDKWSQIQEARSEDLYGVSPGS